MLAVKLDSSVIVANGGRPSSGVHSRWRWTNSPRWMIDSLRSVPSTVSTLAWVRMPARRSRPCATGTGVALTMPSKP